MSNNKTVPNVFVAIALIALCFTATPQAVAQQAADAPPRELPSNQATGVDIDRFIGDPYKAITEVVKVGSDEGYAILGSEIRRVVGTGAFLSPPNGKTTHSSMNLSTENPSIWLYISRRVPQD